MSRRTRREVPTPEPSQALAQEASQKLQEMRDVMSTVLFDLVAAAQANPDPSVAEQLVGRFVDAWAAAFLSAVDAAAQAQATTMAARLMAAPPAHQ